MRLIRYLDSILYKLQGGIAFTVKFVLYHVHYYLAHEGLIYLNFCLKLQLYI